MKPTAPRVINKPPISYCPIGYTFLPPEPEDGPGPGLSPYITLNTQITVYEIYVYFFFFLVDAVDSDCFGACSFSMCFCSDKVEDLVFNSSSFVRTDNSVLFSKASKIRSKLKASCFNVIKFANVRHINPRVFKENEYSISVTCLASHLPKGIAIRSNSNILI